MSHYKILPTITLNFFAKNGIVGAPTAKIFKYYSHNSQFELITSINNTERVFEFSYKESSDVTNEQRRNPIKLRSTSNINLFMNESISFRVIRRIGAVKSALLNLSQLSSTYPCNGVLYLCFADCTQK